MNEWVLLAIGVALTLGTGVFVASEFTLVNLDRNELESRRDRGEKGLGPIIAALRHTSTQLSGAQLGITLTTLLTGYTMEPAVTKLLGGLFLALGVPEDWVSVVGAVVAMVFATLLSMLVGELIPKNLALALPVEVAKIVVPVQRAFTTVFRLPVRALNGSANALIRSMGIEPKEELSGARTAEELSSLVRRSAIAGVLEDDRAALLSRTLRFSAHTADDVMTPRPRVDAVGVERPVQDVIDLARSTGHSRFPVIDDGIDDVVGLVHVKSAVAVPLDRRGVVPVGAIKQDALLVPETIGLDALLGELRGGGFQMAVVLDEYGGTAGVATLEDLVEEIVGELVDEHDRTQVEQPSRTGRIEFDGLLRPDELRERYNIAIDEDGPYETVGGYVMARLARIPKVGDRVPTETGELEVVRMDGLRVERVRFWPGEDYEPREELFARLDGSRRQHPGRDDRDGGRRG
ncbi:HlyC/CorC family transporter [Pseudoclavibacter chungangensis]|uniref:HlyC/CorC family transporter n=1 Tax=Pseudoclavibacter chungangensis TaxID=587635 RepID=A0A7J5BPG6_9MICO|nr:hemolysin family protein [Pseudoclavibacter chungangensis]KAB1655062.1 HlyC/CorC family transporter [Pseudoclavibacter chungangensis]NYJ66175.1 CBS domain containing-hemolysin-like protein [Pseudoclavibacter chungangensis]